MSQPATTAAPTAESTDQLVVNTIRFLAVDMVEKAKSGHPGAPLGMAPMAWVLWSRFLRVDPSDTLWPGRDRFVLSAGHASALLYALLHLAGYDLRMEELQHFRQVGSKTPGHPEFHHTPGVETTTGPLGQGVGNAVGMAMAQRMLASRLDRDGSALFDYDVWSIASDGDMMEGISGEASSLAGHQKLGRLQVLYDANHISIDGSTDLAFSEDVAARYAAYGWHVQTVDDGNDLEALAAAMRRAQEERERPSLIRVHTVIGYGSPKAGAAKVHGEALGPEATRETKRALGWPEDASFLVPDEARAAFARAIQRGRDARARWQERRARWAQANPELARDLERRLAGELPAGWDAKLPRFDAGASMATRQASGKAINALAPAMPELVGGSADLTESNLTHIEGAEDFEPATPGGRYLHWGVREHAMGSTMNGIALSGLLRPFGGTFLIFSDYMRPAVRLAALMGLPNTYVYTHDSIFLGEDGPTHQPIGQLASLRAIPNLVVLRPADANETVWCWAIAMERRHGPTALALTRQKLPVLAEVLAAGREQVARGGYVLAEADGGTPDLMLLATGSEVHLVLAAQKLLAQEGVRARVVSLPSFELFAAQPREYRDAVLPPQVRARFAVEAASPFGWDRWIGPDGAMLGMERYGESGKYEDLQKAFGFTPENVAAKALELARRVERASH